MSWTIIEDEDRGNGMRVVFVASLEVTIVSEMAKHGCSIRFELTNSFEQILVAGVLHKDKFDLKPQVYMYFCLQPAIIIMVSNF